MTANPNTSMKCSCDTTGYSRARRQAAVCAAFLLVLALPVSSALGAGRFLAISYHDVRYDAHVNASESQPTVSAANLAKQFQWLADHGYTPVSMQRIIDASAGGAQLPERAVLLTFDDGFRSFQDIVLPLLEEFRYPAVLALVTSWLEVAPGRNVRYGTEYKPREAFLTWRQIHEIGRSPLVEIASHSHDLHRGVIGNPQGNSQPAATTRIYSGGGYEPQQRYLDRVRDDIVASLDLIERHTGRRPRVMAWPFGAYTRETTQLIRDLGMVAALTLESGDADVGRLDRIPRLYLSGNPDMRAFARLMHDYFERPTIKRSIRIGLDDIYGDGADAGERRLGEVLDTVKELGINTAVVKAFRDEDDDGAAESMYFPNRHLPMRADLLNRVIWQLRTRAGIRWVYVWMPAGFDSLDAGQEFEVLEDLGRNLYLTGLFIETPKRARRMVHEWAERLQVWQNASASANSEIRLAMGRSLSEHDLGKGGLGRFGEDVEGVVDDLFLMLSPSAVDDLPGHDEIVGFIGELAKARSKLVDYVLEIPAASGEKGVAAVRRFLAAGLPSVGVYPSGSRIDETDLERFRAQLSLRDHPSRP
ncbi:MAG: poly-beta-1,6-N-acetyl-D-glucosamine N-deacetylase PgaB [Proteobacteria bacterium]|nr:MAG: poly-beta-1,6-N-acetyl-D-glucosamine N-deacetylase PgaB [Pseudomonadota bacterium]